MKIDEGRPGNQDWYKLPPRTDVAQRMTRSNDLQSRPWFGALARSKTSASWRRHNHCQTAISENNPKINLPRYDSKFRQTIHTLSVLLLMLTPLNHPKSGFLRIKTFLSQCFQDRERRWHMQWVAAAPGSSHLMRCLHPTWQGRASVAQTRPQRVH